MNWQSLIADIQTRGMSQSQIASACDCGQATVSELANGKNTNPSFKLAQALIALHKSATRRRAVAKA